MRLKFVFFSRKISNGFDTPQQPFSYPAKAQQRVCSKMIPAKSTPNLRDQNINSKSVSSSGSVYTYLQNQSGLNFAPVNVNAATSSAPPQTLRDDNSPPPAPPVRDSSSLKSIKYGPGHEKFPSWPVPAAAETPQVKMPFFISLQSFWRDLLKSQTLSQNTKLLVFVCPTNF